MRKSIILAALLLAIALAAPPAAATIYTKPPTPLAPEEEEAAGLLLDGSIIVGFADACDIDAKALAIKAFRVAELFAPKIWVLSVASFEPARARNFKKQRDGETGVSCAKVGEIVQRVDLILDEKLGRKFDEDRHLAGDQSIARYAIAIGEIVGKYRACALDMDDSRRAHLLSFVEKAENIYLRSLHSLPEDEWACTLEGYLAGRTLGKKWRGDAKDCAVARDAAATAEWLAAP